MKKSKRYPTIGVQTWRVWVSAKGVRHLILSKTNFCTTCGSRDHQGAKEIRNASPA
jgi:hypothetical protein